MTQETARLEAFSDGVFAIAVTLLVLDLKVPRDLSAPELRRALIEQWPSYAAFLVSFATIGIMWLNHHRLFTLIHRVDHTLLMLNGLLLLTITVVPFPTALVSAYLGRPGERISTLVYSGCFVVIAIAFNALWRYAASPAREPPLLRIPVDSPEVRAIHAAYRLGPFWYLAAVALSFWHPTAALAVCGALALFFALPSKSGRLHPPGPDPTLGKPTR
jgi:uncharacterized membrane protein